jgi:hypothetical protein
MAAQKITVHQTGATVMTFRWIESIADYQEPNAKHRSPRERYHGGRNVQELADN